jgi:DNA-binding NarL/FixJ family response regulator
MNAPIRVLVVDDQRVVREGLEMLLGLLDGIEVVGSASDGEEAVARLEETLPDVVLMDLNMPRMDGIEATARITAAHPHVAVVVLTTYSDEERVLAALRAGARGYLTKDAGAEDIERALRRVVAGQPAIDPAVQHHLLDALAAGPAAPAAPRAPDGLTPRELDVLALIADGLSNAEIAARLVVAEATVKTHVNHILAKTGARDRAQVVAHAYRTGIARP